MTHRITEPGKSLDRAGLKAITALSTRSAVFEIIDIMLRRTGKKKADYTLTRGPGNVGRAFGFHVSQCGVNLTSDELFIADDGFKLSKNKIVSSPRVGVDYAGEHAEWHYRFFIKDSPYVSGKK